MTDYFAVKLFINCGLWLIAFIVIGGFGLVAWGVVSATLSGVQALVIGIGVLIVGFIMLVFLDLTRIIADMLLPR